MRLLRRVLHAQATNRRACLWLPEIIKTPPGWRTQPAKAWSSSLHDGEHTAWALPNTLRVPINERDLCLPHIKQDMVAPPNDAAAANGEPDTLDL